MAINANDAALSLSGAAAQWQAITAGTATFSPLIRALYVGVTGNVTVVDKNDNTATFTAVPVGILPVSCAKVTAATAGGLIALY